MKIVFIVWLIGEAILAIATGIKTKKWWIVSVHRNSIRFTAFFAFLGLGWAMLNLPFLNILFGIIIFMSIIATIDYYYWFYFDCARCLELRHRHDDGVDDHPFFNTLSASRCDDCLYVYLQFAQRAPKVNTLSFFLARCADNPAISGRGLLTKTD
jgi:hypothetical protein